MASLPYVVLNSLLTGVLLFTACKDVVLVDDGSGGRFEGGVGNDDSEGDEGRDNQKNHGNWLGRNGAKYNGVDILVVVDNSSTMAEEQHQLATEIYSLITSLTAPIGEEEKVENVRVAFTTSDMGLQYGASGEALTPVPSSATGCDAQGDDGDFMTAPGSSEAVNLIDGEIPCEPYGNQCPVDWSCEAGVCRAPEEEGEQVICNFTQSSAWLETSVGKPNPDLATQAACLAIQGTGGCNVEQQLEASIRALAKHGDFLDESHMLLVLVVSDEEDCSIKDSGLFQTSEWLSGPQQNFHMACNVDTSENYLFSPDRYYEELVALKQGNDEGVVFIAVVGVPNDADSPCVGDGDALLENDCLNHEDMALTPSYGDMAEGTMITHFSSACTQGDGMGRLKTVARPGRRFVTVAESFGAQGYVESICNDDWSLTRQHVQKLLKSVRVSPVCLIDASLNVEDKADSCESCFESNCMLYAEVVQTDERSQAQGDYNPCPAGMRSGDWYEHLDDDGVKLVLCPIAKLPSELDCELANKRYAADAPLGWYYCENSTAVEGTEYTCSDDIDNDHNGFVDCEANACKGCSVCGAVNSNCELGCRYDIVLTSTANDITNGLNLLLECPIYQ